MTPEQVKAHFGTNTATAMELTKNGWRCTPQAVGQWEENGEVPMGRQYQIQVITKNKLVADAQPSAA